MSEVEIVEVQKEKPQSSSEIIVHSNKPEKTNKLIHYHPDLFLDRNLSFFETLECSICHYVFEDPVFAAGNLIESSSLSQCGHTFCCKCLTAAAEASLQADRTPHCPICMAVIPVIKVCKNTFCPNRQIRKMIESLRMRCLHYAQGCTWTGVLQDPQNEKAESFTSIHSHLQNDCDYAVGECQHVGCDAILAGAQRKIHEITCEFRLVPCDFCNKSIQWRLLVQHQQTECEEVMVECPNKCIDQAEANRVEELKELEENGFCVQQKQNPKSNSTKRKNLRKQHANDSHGTTSNITKKSKSQVVAAAEDQNTDQTDQTNGTFIHSATNSMENLANSSCNSCDQRKPVISQSHPVNHNVSPPVTQIKRKMLKKHFEVCEMQQIPCPYEFVGCKSSLLKRRDMTMHCEQQTQNHTKMVQKYFSDRNNNNNNNNNNNHSASDSYFDSIISPIFKKYQNADNGSPDTWRQNLQQGDLVDCLDPNGGWYLSCVYSRLSQGSVQVEYIGYDRTYIESFSVLSSRLQPPWSKSKGLVRLSS